MRAAVKQPCLSVASAGTWRPEPPKSSICRWGQLPASAPRSASVRQLQLCSASARSPCPVDPATVCTTAGTSLRAAACAASPTAPSGSPSAPAAVTSSPLRSLHYDFNSGRFNNMTAAHLTLESLRVHHQADALHVFKVAADGCSSGHDLKSWSRWTELAERAPAAEAALLLPSTGSSGCLRCRGRSSPCSLRWLRAAQARWDPAAACSTPARACPSSWKQRCRSTVRRLHPALPAQAGSSTQPATQWFHACNAQAVTLQQVLPVPWTTQAARSSTRQAATCPGLVTAGCATPCLHKQAAGRLVPTGIQPCLIGKCRLRHAAQADCHSTVVPDHPSAPTQWLPVQGAGLAPAWCRLLPLLGQKAPHTSPHYPAEGSYLTRPNEDQHRVQGGPSVHAALARFPRQEALQTPDLLPTLAAGLSCHTMPEAANAHLEQAGSACAARVGQGPHLPLQGAALPWPSACGTPVGGAPPERSRRSARWPDPHPLWGTPAGPASALLQGRQLQGKQLSLWSMQWHAHTQSAGGDASKENQEDYAPLRRHSLPANRLSRMTPHPIELPSCTHVRQ